MNTVRSWYDSAYASLGFAAQRRYPNEELLRFMGRHFFGIDRVQRSSKKVLELGCGSGANLWMIAREGFETFGLDLSPEALRLCGIMLENWGETASLQAGSILNLPYSSDMFDAVVDVFSTYCVNEIEFGRCLDEVARVTKSGGLYFSYSPSKNSDAFGMHHPAAKIDDSTLDGIARSTSPYYGNTYPFRFISQEEYADLLRNRGFNVISSERIGRTYRDGAEYFEFVSLTAQKA
ncbi:class I SAM-dependent methyltransferase [Bradyrhizobium sp. G127]|uniref:class I SAM-dependent methyltransferase n=1 Tax=Bradyrhizobium sp. G127 TaxID=2904800 RepID=UPI001F23E86F|nr:class I SAM-dependent methyltransferase [Bradyrhizobium sp. G127]MCF2524446.1 class I SAM-dependent methyltransferase [Bradyrhizobium sp. G127]